MQAPETTFRMTILGGEHDLFKSTGTPHHLSLAIATTIQDHPHSILTRYNLTLWLSDWWTGDAISRVGNARERVGAITCKHLVTAYAFLMDETERNEHQFINALLLPIAYNFLIYKSSLLNSFFSDF